MALSKGPIAIHNNNSQVRLAHIILVFFSPPGNGLGRKLDLDLELKFTKRM